MDAKKAYNDLIKKIFTGCNNPTYELCGITLINLYGLNTVNEMEDAGLIKYVGQNCNNQSVYQIR